MFRAQFKKSLWHFDLDIQIHLHNHILVLWGPSGCGKTTILNILAGLLAPDEGLIGLKERVLFSSQAHINLPTRDRNIGYVFQDYALFPHKTVLENVNYGIRCHKSDRTVSCQEPGPLLDSFGVKHLIHRYPNQLSGGERQRVAIARALVVNPQLMLLDEPFSALDHDNKISLRRELKELHNGWQIPFIMVTHDEEDATFLGDAIMHIEKGQIKDSSSQPVVNAHD